MSSLALSAPYSVWAEEDTDSRTNVQVKTKRPSIGSRSLPHLADLAIEHSPKIAQAKHDFDSARLELKNARVAFLPSLDLEAIHGLQDANPRVNAFPTPFTSQTNLVMSEKLYDNGAMLNKLRIAQKAYERAKLDFEYRRDQQLLDMAQAYLDWSTTLAQREIAEKKRDLLHKQANILDAQYRQGLKTKRDVLRIETEIRRLEMDVITLDNDMDLNFQKLAGHVGLTREDLVSEDIEGEEAKPYTGGDAHFSDLNVKTHRRAKILQYDKDQAVLKAEQAERDFGPQISLNGNFGYHLHDYLYTGATWPQENNYDWQALLTFKFNLWDFGTRRRTAEIARVKSKNVQAVNDQTLLELANELRDVSNKLRQYREHVKITRELLVLEQQSYSILEAEYRSGKASYLDVITNLNSYIDARKSFVSSYFGLKKEQMIYAFHKGDLYERLQ